MEGKVFFKWRREKKYEEKGEKRKRKRKWIKRRKENMKEI